MLPLVLAADSASKADESSSTAYYTTPPADVIDLFPSRESPLDAGGYHTHVRARPRNTSLNPSSSAVLSLSPFLSNLDIGNTTTLALRKLRFAQTSMMSTAGELWAPRTAPRNSLPRLLCGNNSAVLVSFRVDRSVRATISLFQVPPHESSQS